MARVPHDLDDGLVEVGEDDLGVGVLAPERAESCAEQRVVALGHAVDGTQASVAIVVRPVGAHALREKCWCTPCWWVPRNDHINHALVDEPLRCAN